MKQGFKRTTPRNNYRSELTTQPKNNNLYYMIDPIFWNINQQATGGSFDRYYMLSVEIKDFNILFDSSPFFDQTIKRIKSHIKNF